ncbi:MULTISPECIES: ABC transporter permease [unclassified Oceanispirochaeta]|uniref:ABC transporter permease n=1 Tax=unclassified Oceanispirochaeta TaxID=2635722 RepID=UPI000E09D881|nr:MULTISPECIES: ABC transporter permease [unclassified Oceanispirochaeta]MBF9014569.1 ABC transporter permease [Oceanispirochaeta sp. M2]NPD70825.1 ABC transporter permease [Oceanispirochaeta sp. M1]RDG34107.1 ABC transporter permease [Oceanispirochaeta sp. M1]
MQHRRTGIATLFKPNLILLWVLFLMVLFFSTQSQAFRSVDNLMEILRSCGIIALMVLGVTWIVASGETDISFPEIAGFASMMTALMVKNGMIWGMAAMVAILSGILYGLLSGTLITRFRFPALIATIAVGSLAKAVANIINKGQPLYLMSIDPTVQFLVYGKVLGLPVLFLLVVVIYGIAAWIQDYTTTGQHLYALGENRKASLEAGIKEKKIIMSFFALSALLASFSGVLLAASFSSGQPRIGSSFFIDGLTTVFLGAMIIKAGKPNVIGTLIGAIIISVLSNGITMLGVPYYIGSIIKGILMIAGVTVIVLSRRGIIK